MQVLHTADPTRNFAGLLVRLVDRVYGHGGGARHILALHVFQFENCLVFVVETGLVEHRNTQVLLLTVWFGHLQESVDLSYSWDVIWNEWLDLGF